MPKNPTPRDYSSFYINLTKWWITIKISWVKHTAYRLNFFLQVIGPAIMFFFIKYNLWAAIYADQKGLVIQGFNFDQMVTYHTWTFAVAIIGQGHGSWNLSEDIRMGRISSYLIYPFNFWEFHTASFLSFQVLQILIVAISLIFFYFIGISIPEVWVLFKGFSFTLVVSFFWYALQYLTGVMAFWLEETWILRVILSIVTTFLSGAIIPLDLYPEWLVNTLQYTPFPYLVYYPVQIFMERPVALLRGYLIIIAWIGFFTLISRWAWRKGIRLYTAAGM